MMMPSPLCPLSFDSASSRAVIEPFYLQRFDTASGIYLQFDGKSNQQAYIDLADACTGLVVSSLSLNEKEAALGQSEYSVELRPSDGIYSAVMRCGGDVLYSNLFEVTESSVELDRYMVIRYGEDLSFRFLVEGGFLSDSDTCALDNEFFRNQLQQPEQLYQYPYVKRKLTIGNAVGVPQWVGTLMNNIFCCDLVLIDGIEYARSENDTPEMVKIGGDRYSLFQFSIEIENSAAYSGGDIHSIPVLRAVSEDLYRLIAVDSWRSV